MKQKLIIAFFITFVIHFLFAQQKPVRDNFDIKSKLNWVGVSGCWDFSKEIFKAQGFARYNIAYYNQSVFTDFIYEVKINKLSEDGTFGLLFRYDEVKGEGYVLQFWPHGQYKFEILKKGAEPLRRGKSKRSLNQIIGENVWNTIKIIGAGSKFKIYLNGNLQEVFFNNTFKSGRLGLFLGGDPRQIALFEIIKIETL